MSVNTARATIRVGKTALLVCDIQERFAKAICGFNNIVANSARLIQACKVFNVPVIVAEQNPKALGKTVKALNIDGYAKGPYCKTQFSLLIPEIEKDLKCVCPEDPIKSVLLIGFETHGCIEISAIDLLNKGFEVHPIADCCSSRSQEDRLLAFERMKQMGCNIATSESVIFQLLRDCKHKNFKEIQKIISIPTTYTGLAHI